MKFYYLIVVVVLIVRSKADNTQNHAKPNILIILTDDQDVTLYGMKPMQHIQELLGYHGASFDNAFTTSPLCCPSRASLLTGKYAHNHKTLNNSVSGGCYSDHWQSQCEPETLAVRLQEIGYSTFYAGKYLNQYMGEHIPMGWQHFYGLHGNSRYYNYTLRENEKNISYTDAYLTDMLRDKAVHFLRSRTSESPPFLAMIAPTAPHQPFTPAARHSNAFADVRALHTPNFNRPAKSKHWLVGHSKPITEDVLQTMDDYYRKRWQTLLAVDELVADVVRALTDTNELDNTYIIYSSDNGYHIGQNAQPYDKRQPYETDIRIPLLIRGPSIPAGVKVTAPIALIDILPTIMEWLQIPTDPKIDGQSFHSFLQRNGYDFRSDRAFHRSLLIQHHGEGNLETYNPDCPWQSTDMLSGCTLDAGCHCQDARNNTYACVRHFGYRLNRLYCEFDDDQEFQEFYDLEADPFQLRNTIRELLPIERAIYGLALTNLTKCAGSSSCNDVVL